MALLHANLTMLSLRNQSTVSLPAANADNDRSPAREKIPPHIDDNALVKKDNRTKTNSGHNFLTSSFTFHFGILICEKNGEVLKNKNTNPCNS